MNNIQLHVLIQHTVGFDKIRQMLYIFYDIHSSYIQNHCSRFHFIQLSRTDKLNQVYKLTNGRNSVPYLGKWVNLGLLIKSTSGLQNEWTFRALITSLFQSKTLSLIRETLLNETFTVCLYVLHQKPLVRTVGCSNCSALKIENARCTVCT